MKETILKIRKIIDEGITPIIIGALGSALFFLFQQKVLKVLWVILAISIFMISSQIYLSYLKRKYPENCPYCGRIMKRQH